MGGKSSGNNKTTIRYAPYIESQHQSFLSTVRNVRTSLIGNGGGGEVLSFVKWLITYKRPEDGNWVSIADYVTNLNNGTYAAEYQSYVDSCSGGQYVSPFADYADVEVESAFFGLGYGISSFPSLYDMFGKFMAGLDIEVLWSQEFEDTVNSSVVNDLISAESALMDDDIETNVLPRHQIGMRDMNAVMGSSYVIGKAIIEDARVKALAKYDAELRYRLIPVAQSRWQTHLEWNNKVVGVYAELMKFYYAAKTDINEANYSMAAKDKLWPFTVLDFERAALGALQGATNQKSDVAGASTASRVLSGALNGAAMGAMVGGSISNTSAGAAAGSTYAGTGSLVGAGLGIAAALTY